MVSFGFGPDMVHSVVFMDLTSFCFGDAGFVGLVAIAGVVTGWSQHTVGYACLCACHLIHMLQHRWFCSRMVYDVSLFMASSLYMESGGA